MGTSAIGGIGGGLFTGATGSRQLGKEEFLRLLVTQLRHQDPLNPMDGTQFATQLAQFSSLEQLISLNDGLDAQAEVSALAAITVRTSLGAALMGREIVAAGDQVAVGEDGRVAVTVDIGSGGGRAEVRLLDEQGREVARRDVGQVGSGRQVLSWGADDLPSGVYRYEVTVENGAGGRVPVTTFVTGVVDGLFFENGQIVLRAGKLVIPMDRLSEIRPHSAAG